MPEFFPVSPPNDDKKGTLLAKEFCATAQSGAPSTAAQICRHRGPQLRPKKWHVHRPADLPTAVPHHCQPQYSTSKEVVHNNQPKVDQSFEQHSILPSQKRLLTPLDIALHPSPQEELSPGAHAMGKAVIQISICCYQLSVATEGLIERGNCRVFKLEGVAQLTAFCGHARPHRKRRL